MPEVAFCQTISYNADTFEYEAVSQENGNAAVIKFPIDQTLYSPGDVVVVLTGEEIAFHGIIGKIDDGYAYASDPKKKQPALQALADYSEATLLNLRGSRLSDVASALLAELPNHKAVLEDEYGLDKARIKELQDAISAFNDVKSAPRQAQIDGQTN